MDFTGFIFKQFPDYFWDNDSYKIGEGGTLGFLQRFTKIFEDELDENIIPEVENFINELNPALADAKFINELAYLVGSPPDIFDTTDIDVTDPKYRLLLSYISKLYKLKGTKKSYILLFSFIGLGVTIWEESTEEFLYNDGITFYNDPVILPYYNSHCRKCSDYRIIFWNLSDPCNGPFTLVSNDLITKLDPIICFLEPINANLKSKDQGYNFCDPVSFTFGETIEIQTILSDKYNTGLLYNNGIIYDSGSIINDITITY